MNIIRVTLIAALLATTSMTAIADTSSMNGSVTGMGILENDYVKAGTKIGINYTKTKTKFGTTDSITAGLTIKF